MMLKLFKYAFEKDIDLSLKAYLIATEEAKEEESEETIIYYASICLKYIEATNKEITKEDIKRQIKELKGKGEIIMTLLERIEAEGMEKGIEKGKLEVARKAITKGMDLEDIADLTGLSIEEIAKIKKKIFN